MKSRTNQPIYNDNGKLAQDMPNTSASDSGKVLGIDESGKVVPVSSGTKLYKHHFACQDDNQTFDLTIEIISTDNTSFANKTSYNYSENGDICKFATDDLSDDFILCNLRWESGQFIAFGLFSDGSQASFTASVYQLGDTITEL